MIAGVLGIPAEWTTPILVAKGVLAVSGVLLLLWHMDHEWDRIDDPAQRARYLLLLGYAVLVSGATVEQLKAGVQLSYQHLGATTMSAALVVVTILSIRRARATMKHPQKGANDA